MDVLLVEDDELWRDCLSDMLREAGLCVTADHADRGAGHAGCDGNSNRARGGDVHLGARVDGFGLAIAARRRWPGIRATAMSGDRTLYPRATSILLLCDGGGSNSSSQYLFKEDLQRLVERLGIEIRVAHYPPYCSKYNPIEHRLFPHVTRACQGVIFESVELVKELMEKAGTSTGLRVTVDILDRVYQTGRKYAEGFKENMKIVFDEILPKWNYRAVPSGS